MSFFDFFKHNKKDENQPTIQKLANRYLVESDDYWIPLGRPKRNYKITDMTDHKVFELNVIYDIFDSADLPKEEAPYYSLEDSHYKVSVSVNAAENEDKLAFFSAEIFQKDFKDKRINSKDVDLALYNQLKEARANASNPQRQEEAYLVSTLLRAAHDNIWIAPLLMHKHDPEYAQKLEQIKINVEDARKKVQNKTQAYEQKRKEKQDYEEELFSLFPHKKQKQAKAKLSAEQMQQKTSEYIKSLMKENFVDGI